MDRQTDGQKEKQMPMLQSQEVREMFHARFNGCLDRQTDGRKEKRTPMSQSQEDREMFHARFNGCLVL